MRIDGLFLPVKRRDEKPIYFVEVQYYKDANIYANLFAEVFIYLNQNDHTQDWQAVVLYSSRNLEPSQLNLYIELLNPSKVRRIYLDELVVDSGSSLGLGIIDLVRIDPQSTPEKVKELLARSQVEIDTEQIRENVINLIETIVVYKLPNLSREELEAMLDLADLKKTKLAQELLAEGPAEGRVEGKLEIVPTLLKLGFSVEVITEILGLEMETIRRIAGDK